MHEKDSDLILKRDLSSIKYSEIGIFTRKLQIKFRYRKSDR